MANDIPAISKSQLGDNARPVERIREELQVLLGLRGDPMDKAMTLREAVERGLIDSAGRALAGSPSYQNYYPVGLGGGGSSTEADLTPPPTPTGLSVAAGFSQVVVQWNAPTYTQGHGNLYTYVYAVKRGLSDPLPTFEPGVTPRVFSAPGALNVVSLPSELNTRWHVWITFFSLDGVESPTPAGGANGFSVGGVFPTTGQDITQLLGLLVGQISESHLYGTLGARINMIDGPATEAGTVAARIKAETDARVAAIASEAGYRSDGDTSTLNAAKTYAETWAYSRSQADGAIAATATALRAEFLGADEITLASAQSFTTGFAYAKASGDALAGAVTSLTAKVDNPSAAAGANYNPTYAALLNEQSVRAALDGAVAALWTLRAEVSSGGRTMVGGWSLSATATASAGPRIDFGVRADQFFVAAPAGSGVADRIPFIIRTTAVTENGVSIPAGVYMDAAYIANLSAMYARIQSLVADQITAASISVGQLVAGSMAVGAYAQSTGFVSGSSGWRISGNGTAEFSGVVVRGTIFATAGTIGGNTIDSTGIQSPIYTPGSTGFRFDSSGLVRAFAASGARVLDMAATGSAPVLKVGTALEVRADGSATYGGALNVKSATSGARMEITDSAIKVFDGTRLRVQLGNLAV